MVQGVLRGVVWEAEEFQQQFVFYENVHFYGLMECSFLVKKLDIDIEIKKIQSVNNTIFEEINEQIKRKSCFHFGICQRGTS